ncbi:hypothetical protein NDI48_18805 [Microcoleus sp. AS-A8]
MKKEQGWMIEVQYRAKSAYRPLPKDVAIASIVIVKAKCRREESLGCQNNNISQATKDSGIALAPTLPPVGACLFILGENIA